MKKIIIEADPSRVIEGLRDTGYDFKTAMADLVDNSIAANATSIKVRIQEDLFGKFSIFIADNGDGMDLDGLKNAMRYGSAARTDKSSLGKFGMGLKTASTAFSTLTTWSKAAPTAWRAPRPCMSPLRPDTCTTPCLSMAA
jgi:DNA topoisomerase VI subunit B